jgi:hypothetical protein
MTEKMSFCVTMNNFDEVMSYLFEHYQRNETAILDTNEIELLNNVSEKINSLFTSQGIQFNKEGFKTHVERLYPKNIMFGGNDEILDYTNVPRKKMVFSIYDFIAILGLIASIYIIYLSFVQFNEMICNITGNSVIELPSIVKDKLSESIKSLSGEELSYLSYMYKIFINFSNNIVSQQQKQISKLIHTTLTTAIPDITDRINSQCLTSETGWTGFFESATRSIISPTATTNCITRMTEILMHRFLNDQNEKINTLLTGLNTRTTQIQDLVFYGTKLGYASMAYLTYRIPQIIRGIPKGIQTNSNNNLYIENGGTQKRKRKSKTKKIKRKYHSFNKIKRKTKKNKMRKIKKIYK